MPRKASQDRVLAYNYEAVQAACAIDGRRTEYRIEGVDGLVLRVMPSGSGSWWFYYRHRLGSVWKLRKIHLGDRKGVRLATVKDRAAELTQEIASNKDPVGADQRQRHAITFQELAEQRLERDQRIGSVTKADYRRLLELRAFAKIGAYPASQITMDMVSEVLNTITSDRQADITKAAIGSTFRWGMKRNLVKHNPCLGLGQRAPIGVRTNVLDDHGIKALWAATGSGSEMHTVLRLLLLTGQRRSEVHGTQPQELKLDSDRPVWIIRGDTLDRGRVIEGRTKNGKEQRVPLSRQAAELFKSAKLPFDVKRADSITGAMVDLKLGATVHDLRRTLATWLGEQGVLPDVIDLILNHAPKAQDITRRHYNFAKLEPAVRNALQAWADHVEALVSSEKAIAENVVPLRAQGAQ
jgi:integrase